MQKQLRTFGTATRELLSLREWLLSPGCTRVAMESTVKKVPGRKTDVKDAEWNLSEGRI